MLGDRNGYGNGRGGHGASGCGAARIALFQKAERSLHDRN